MVEKGDPGIAGREHDGRDPGPRLSRSNVRQEPSANRLTSGPLAPSASVSKRTSRRPDWGRALRSRTRLSRALRRGRRGALRSGIPHPARSSRPEPARGGDERRRGHDERAAAPLRVHRRADRPHRPPDRRNRELTWMQELRARHADVHGHALVLAERDAKPGSTARPRSRSPRRATARSPAPDHRRPPRPRTARRRHGRASHRARPRAPARRRGRRLSNELATR